MASVRCKVGPLSPVGEEIGQLLQKLRFPAADQVGVDAEYAGQLGDGFLALDGPSRFWGSAQSQVLRML